MTRKMKHFVVTVRGEGLRKVKSTQAGPVLPLCLTHTHAYKSKAPPVPCHLLAYLKVTCRKRWMCGLQTLKRPHEAKEPFVSEEELESPG